MSTLQLGSDVAWVQSGDEPGQELTVVVARIPDGEPLVLRDSSALIWLTALDTGHRDDTVVEILEAIDDQIAADTVRRQVHDFIDWLVGEGLLCEAQPSSRPSR